MNPIIIENTMHIKKQLKNLELIHDRDIIVFDIHRTTLYKNYNNQTSHDMKVLIYITYFENNRKANMIVPDIFKDISFSL